MNEVLFVERREPDWKKLNLLTAKADASPVNLSPEELEEFVKVYKRVSADLAAVRTQSANTDLIEFLNDLCGRAYGVLYRAPRANLGKAVVNGIRTSAQTVRRQWRFVVASASLLVLSGLFAYFCMVFVPDTKAHFIPAQLEGAFKNWKEGAMPDRGLGESLGQTGFYMGNNPRVAIVSGSISAATFGVGSAFLIYSNGAILGALVYEVSQVGRVGYLFAQILPHGVTELSGMILSGASGFVMGWALIRPGRRTRGDALRRAGKDALTLLITSVALMFIAAPIEGFFSFNPNIPIWAKVAFAAISAVAWAAFWIGFGKEPLDADSKSASAI